MRVVLDTNVLVSSLLAPYGNERRVLNLAFSTRFTLLVSDEILTEYQAVLCRPELKLRAEEVADILAGLHRLAVRVRPTETISVSPHEADNRFLECAVAGDADYLVTGNKRHFPPRWRRTRVINARQFLQLLAPTNPKRRR